MVEQKMKITKERLKQIIVQESQSEMNESWRDQYRSRLQYLSAKPEADRTPEEEKEFLENYKGRLFAMLTDYNFSNHEVEED